MNDLPLARARHTVLMLPGWTNSGPEHWQTIWERDHSEYRRVQQNCWDRPKRAEWIATIARAVNEAATPVILVAHSLGCLAAAGLAKDANATTIARVAGAFLVAAADVERPASAAPLRAWRPIPLEPLPFASLLIASRNDEYSSYERSIEFASAWGSRLVDLGEAGHINAASGYGPWPAGHAMLLEFIATL
jgi:predicted alpha/beta hydrolase family esterase